MQQPDSRYAVEDEDRFSARLVHNLKWGFLEKPRLILRAPDPVSPPSVPQFSAAAFGSPPATAAGVLGEEGEGAAAPPVVDKWRCIAVESVTPTVREGAAAFSVGRSMFVHGGTLTAGTKRNGRSNNLFRLDLDTGKWRLVECRGHAVAPRAMHTATVLPSGTDVFVFGGEGDPEPGQQKSKRRVFSDLFALNLRTCTWRVVQHHGGPPFGLMPSPRCGHTATLVPATRVRVRRQLANAASASAHAHGAAVRDTALRIVVFGGSGPDRVFMQDGYLNDVQVLDVGSLEWREATTSGTPPSQRASHTAALVRSAGAGAAGGIVVFGGLSAPLVPHRNQTRCVVPPGSSPDAAGPFATPEVHVLDAESFAWSQPVVGGASPGPRYGHTCLAGPDSAAHLLFVFGGRPRDDAPTSCVFVLDTLRWAWSTATTAGVPPAPRYNHVAVTVPQVLSSGAGGGGGADGSADNAVADPAGSRRGSLLPSELARELRGPQMLVFGGSAYHELSTGALSAFGFALRPYVDAVEAKRLRQLQQQQQRQLHSIQQGGTEALSVPASPGTSPSTAAAAAAAAATCGPRPSSAASAGSAVASSLRAAGAARTAVAPSTAAVSASAASAASPRLGGVGRMQQQQQQQQLQAAAAVQAALAVAAAAVAAQEQQLAAESAVARGDAPRLWTPEDRAIYQDMLKVLRLSDAERAATARETARISALRGSAPIVDGGFALSCAHAHASYPYNQAHQVASSLLSSAVQARNPLLCGWGCPSLASAPPPWRPRLQS
jgi:hypothetical protein